MIDPRGCADKSNSSFVAQLHELHTNLELMFFGGGMAEIIIGPVVYLGQSNCDCNLDGSTGTETMTIGGFEHSYIGNLRIPEIDSHVGSGMQINCAAMRRLHALTPHGMKDSDLSAMKRTRY